MLTLYKNIVVDLISRFMVIPLVLFAFYILANGHHSPGGGFQAGAMLAASVMLLRLTEGREYAHQKFPPKLAIILGGIGLLIYAGTGIIAIVSGGNFLDYGHLPIPWLSAPFLRYFGILIVEIGITLGVFGAMVAIFDNLIKEQ